MRKSRVGVKMNNRIYDDVLKYGYGTANPDREKVQGEPTIEQMHSWFSCDELAGTLVMILNNAFTDGTTGDFVTSLRQDYEILVRQGRI